MAHRFAAAQGVAVAHWVAAANGAGAARGIAMAQWTGATHGTVTQAINFCTGTTALGNGSAMLP